MFSGARTNWNDWSKFSLTEVAQEEQEGGQGVAEEVADHSHLLKSKGFFIAFRMEGQD